MTIRTLAVDADTGIATPNPARRDRRHTAARRTPEAMK